MLEKQHGTLEPHRTLSTVEHFELLEHPMIQWGMLPNLSGTPGQLGTP